jgi:GxxExxY protein
MAIRDPQTHAILGAAVDVHRGLGPGFLESVYHKAPRKELVLPGIPFRDEVELNVSSKDEGIGAHSRAGFVCCEDVVVELKAIRVLSPADETQIIHYLTATRIKRGLLLNFGGESLEWQRRVRGYED